MRIPKEVIDLAEQRIQARASKDFALSDQLRDKIAELGFVIKDKPDGYELLEKPPFEVFENLASIKFDSNRLSKRITICLLVDGWLADTKECLEALLKFMPKDASILALDLGNKDSVGNYLADTQKSNENLVVVHISQTLEQAGWANSINKLIELNPAEFSVVMDLSSIIKGERGTI